MTNSFGDILLQAGYYGIVMVITTGMVGVLQKGFFWKFVRVKLSFGKLILVKIKAVNRDYYRVGRIEDNNLVYKSSNKKEGEKRISVPDNTFFYRSVGCTWVDVDDEDNFLISPKGAVTGFDAVKYNNLYVRALTRPNMNDQKEKIILAGVLLMVILMVGVGFLIYKQGMQIEALKIAMNGLAQNVKKGVLVAGG